MIQVLPFHYDSSILLSSGESFFCSSLFCSSSFFSSSELGAVPCTASLFIDVEKAAAKSAAERVLVVVEVEGAVVDGVDVVGAVVVLEVTGAMLLLLAPSPAKIRAKSNACAFPAAGGADVVPVLAPALGLPPEGDNLRANTSSSCQKISLMHIQS